MVKAIGMMALDRIYRGGVLFVSDRSLDHLSIHTEHDDPFPLDFPFTPWPCTKTSRGQGTYFLGQI
jgi:hypothetical protein